MIRLLPAILLILFLVALLMLTGCTSRGKNLHRARAEIVERARETVAVAAAAIRRQPVAHVTPETKLTSKAIERTQSLLGLPINPQDAVVDALLSSNEVLRVKAEMAWDKATRQEAEWKAKEVELSARLEEMGRVVEAERNKSIVKRVWFWAISTLGIGGIVTLCIFCPGFLLIFPRIIGWVVGLFPKLAGWLGVVGTKAYDAVVEGVERAKAEYAKHPDGENDLQVLKTSLGRTSTPEQDALTDLRRVKIKKRKLNELKRKVVA